MLASPRQSHLGWSGESVTKGLLRCQLGQNYLPADRQQKTTAIGACCSSSYEFQLPRVDLADDSNCWHYLRRACFHRSSPVVSHDPSNLLLLLAAYARHRLFRGPVFDCKRPSPCCPCAQQGVHYCWFRLAKSEQFVEPWFCVPALAPQSQRRSKR